MNKETDAMKIVSDLAVCDPTDYSWLSSLECHIYCCRLCKGEGKNERKQVKHTKTCPYRRAVELISKEQ